jgi:hypothetical protein
MDTLSVYAGRLVKLRFAAGEKTERDGLKDAWIA